MTTFSVDLASMGVTFLFLAISFVAGVGLAVAFSLLSAAGSFFLGLAEAIAGGRPSASAPKGSALAVFIRAIIYVVAGFAALVLAANGYALFGNLLAIAAAFALGIAVVRFFSRL